MICRAIRFDNTRVSGFGLRLLFLFTVANLNPLVVTALHCQTWTNGISGSIYYSGKVGVGSMNPGTAGGGGTPRTLEILGQSGQPVPWGQLVLSTPNAANPNDILGGIEFASRATAYQRGGYIYAFKESSSTGVAEGRLEFGVANSSINSGVASTAMTIKSDGKIGIGTTSPLYLLSVKGTIQAKEIIVTNYGWADYVFSPSYQIPTLKQVGAYVKAYQHLPGIPAESEVKETGVGVGEMQVKLLAKIEELTLYLISADERIAKLEQQIREFASRRGEP